MRWRLAVVLALSIFPSLWTVAQVDHNQNASTPDPKTAGSQQTQHRTGKDDLNAIGNRKIGGKGLGNWYSLGSEIALGREYAQAVESSVRLLDDPIITEYVNRIGQTLVHNSDAKVPFTIKVIDSDEINAFALPGGFMYVNTGVILVAQDEAELAAVMAHEIAHVAARHATRQKTRSNLIGLASIPLIFAGGGAGFAIQQALRLGVPLTMTRFSRSFEAEADYLGVEYLYKTGYDPQAFISFFERVTAQEKKKPGKLTTVFSTHPPTTDRLKKTQDEISRILPARDLYTVTTSEFYNAKARLRSIEGRRGIDEQGHREPTLRRATASSTGPDADSNPDDERPTLKRRDH
jgi:predicted Zn-dependent protease